MRRYRWTSSLECAIKCSREVLGPGGETIMVDKRVKATQEVLQLIERVHAALDCFHCDGITDQAALAHAYFQKGALQIAREELAKAIVPAGYQIRTYWWCSPPRIGLATMLGDLECPSREHAS
jgi:hypothetical protein